MVDGRWLVFRLFVPKLLILASVPFWAISPPPDAKCLAPSLAPQLLGRGGKWAGWHLGRSPSAWGGYSSLKRTAGSSLWDRAVRTLSNFS